MNNEKDKKSTNEHLFWQTNQNNSLGITNEENFDKLLLAICELSPQQLKDGSKDYLIESALNACSTKKNKEGLLKVAYRLFSLKKTELRMRDETKHLIFLLYYLFYDDQSFASDIAFLIWELYDNGRAILAEKTDCTPQKPPEEIWGENVTEIKDNNIDEVIISHGGGLYYITDFLAGRNLGYRLESESGLGLQVSPTIDPNNYYFKRAKNYALQSYGQGWFDLPAVLTAKISRQYLTAATRCYEAGLISKYRSQLKDLKIKIICPKSSPMHRPAGSCEFNASWINERYASSHPEVAKRLINCVNRLAKEGKIKVYGEKQECNRQSYRC